MNDLPTQDPPTPIQSEVPQDNAPFSNLHPHIPKFIVIFLVLVNIGLIVFIGIKLTSLGDLGKFAPANIFVSGPKKAATDSAIPSTQPLPSVIQSNIGVKTPTPTISTGNQLSAPTPTKIATKSAPTATPILRPTNTPIPKATNTPIPAPTATPTPRTPNPPQITISYPTNGQDITMDNTQTFCLVDVPSGGDTNGVERKYNSNGGGWSNYAGINTFCFSPAEGSNALQLQYRNTHGEESPVYSVQFNFHRTN